MTADSVQVKDNTHTHIWLTFNKLTAVFFGTGQGWQCNVIKYGLYSATVKGRLGDITTGKQRGGGNPTLIYSSAACVLSDIYPQNTITQTGRHIHIDVHVHLCAHTHKHILHTHTQTFSVSHTHVHIHFLCGYQNSSPSFMQNQSSAVA